MERRRATAQAPSPMAISGATRLMLGLILLSIMVMPWGCRSQNGEPTAASESTVTLLYPADISLFGPRWDDSPKFLLFLPLVNYERGSSCGEPTPVLAERWEHSPDYREWTVWLREGVRWHDGVPVTADDIVFTIETLTHPEVLSYNAGPVDSALAVDPRTVKLFMSRPNRWPLDGWVTFMPRHLLESEDPAEFTEWEFWQSPVGNGPFRHARHVPGTMIELEANPDYYRGEPQIKRVVIKLSAAGSQSGLLELRSGNVDIIRTTLLQASAIERDPRHRVAHRVSSSHTRWLLYHPEHPIFSDRQVRRAMTHAIDRPALQAARGLPEGLPQTDGPYSVCQFESRTVIEPWAHDEAEAVRLLERAGWSDGDGDGVREQAGRDLRFTVLASRDDVRSAVLLQAQLRRLGIEMEIRQLEGSVAASRLREGDFEAGIFPHVLPIMLLAPDLPSPVSEIFLAAYPEIVALFDSLRVEPDRTAREGQFQRLAQRFREELPATFLHPMAYPIAASRRIRGFDQEGWIPPSWRWAFGGLEFLWIEEAVQKEE